MTSLNDNVLVKVENLRKWFPVRESLFSFTGKEKYVRAVNNVSFNIKRGERLGLAGESGCGKTTICRLILALIRPTSGRVYFEGQEIFSKNKKELKRMRREMQMIFQDPYDSLSERLTIYNIIAEPLRIHKAVKNKNEERAKIKAVLESVNLTPPEKFFNRHPRNLSGGQKQRVAMARALILKPKFVVADEPVSMLDVSIRAEVLKLMLELQRKHGLTYLFITHDFSVARYTSDRIIVLYLGKIVENGLTERIILNPMHPYTKALISVVPIPNPRIRHKRLFLEEEIPDPTAPPAGCMFHPRCQYAQEICRTKEPPLMEHMKDHYAACHYAGELSQ